MPEFSVELRLHEASIEIEQLISLMRALTEWIAAIADRWDPAEAAEVAADLARIAIDGLARVLAKLGS